MSRKPPKSYNNFDKRFCDFFSSTKSIVCNGVTSFHFIDMVFPKKDKKSSSIEGQIEGLHTKTELLYIKEQLLFVYSYTKLG